MTQDPQAATITLSMGELERLVSDLAEDSAEKAVRKVLKEIGLSTTDEDKVVEARADLDQLRRWRKAWDRSVVVVGTAVLMTVAGGIMVALWLGIRTHILKQP